jgi:hypothetical protein
MSSILTDMAAMMPAPQPDRRQQKKPTRQERRAAQLADRRQAKRTAPKAQFEDLIEQVQAHRDIDFMTRKAIEKMPIGSVNQGAIDNTFGPVERWLDHMEQTGEMEVMQDGTPVFLQEGDGEPYYIPLVENFTNMCDTFELIAQKYGFPDKTDGMRRLIKRIEVDMPLFEQDTKACRDTLAWMREVIAHLTPKQYSEVAIAMQVREEMARIEREAKRQRRSTSL